MGFLIERHFNPHTVQPKWKFWSISWCNPIKIKSAEEIWKSTFTSTSKLYIEIPSLPICQFLLKMTPIIKFFFLFFFLIFNLFVVIGNTTDRNVRALRNQYKQKNKWQLVYYYFFRLYLLQMYVNRYLLKF